MTSIFLGFNLKIAGILVGNYQPPLHIYDYPQRYEENIYARVQQSSMEQIGREEGLSYDEIKGIFTHVNSCKKKAFGSQLNE